ncbi:branched-chain amino acid ABC transporter permease [Bacillus sp. JJ1533]|uniref:branched-chain amino acid ABC transporter permease n=1 Tax=Bacillus sp. JJ1533 TaxID=3122959 RepID=UPI002FFF48D9
MSLKSSTLSWLSLFIIGVLWVSIFGSYFQFLFVLFAVYILASIGMNFLIGFTEQISLGNAAFFGIGAYAFAVCQSFGYSNVFGILLGALIASALAFLIGLVTIRILDIYLAVGTLALPFLFLQLTKELDITGGTGGLSVSPLIGKTNAEPVEIVLIVSIVALLGFISSLIAKSFVGRAYHATRLSEHGAKARGINIVKYKISAFMLSAFLTSIGGSFYAAIVGYINPGLFEVQISVNFIIMAIVGGRGSIAGSVLGAAFIVIIPAVSNIIGFGQWQQIGLGIGLAVILLSYPSGLYGILVAILNRLSAISIFKTEKN